MIGWMRWCCRSISSHLPAAVLILLLGVQPSISSPKTGRLGQSEPDEKLSHPEQTAQDFLQVINELRLERGSPPLQLSEPLSHAAGILLERAVIEPVITGFDAEAGLTTEDLRTSGYDPQQWAVGLASSKGEVSEIVAHWRQADSQSFAAFLEPGLRDFGLATEIWAIPPVYALVGATSRAQANQPILDELADLEIVRQQLLDRVNAEREESGLGPLRLSRELNTAAQTYADRMMQGGFYGHVSPRGDTVMDRIEATGYRAEYTGENLASGPPAVGLAMDSWMASQGHRKNILDRRFRDVGFGLSILDVDGALKVLWVQCFGRRRP